MSSNIHIRYEKKYFHLSWLLLLVCLCRVSSIPKIVNFFHSSSVLCSVKHNMTLMFNSIETKERYEEDAVEHGNQIPLSDDHKSSEKSSYK